MAAKPYSSKQLTKHLRELAAEAHTWSEECGVITKGEALAKLLWNKALGYEEETVDDEGVKKKQFHPPASWAIQLIYDRMEGKTPQAVPEDEGRIRAVDKVSELARSRVNALATTAANPNNIPPPPPVGGAK